MNENTCHDIYAKLTKAERFESIEMLVKNIDSCDEIEIFVSALDLHLTRATSNSTADIVDEDEVHASVEDADTAYVGNNTGDKLFSRENCEEQLTNERNYKCNMKLYHDDEKEVFSCKKCVKQFSSKGSLYIHKKRVHKESKHYICDVCSKPCGFKSDLEIHRRVHTGERIYSCSICPKTFNQISHLNKHRKFVHEKEINVNTFRVKSLQCPMTEKKLFPCEKCNKQLTSKGTYNRHMQLYHDNKKEKELFLCKKCDKKLISKASLYIHNKRVHEESERFICDVCSRPCGSKADLERHTRVHTEEKPYSCSICPKTFKRIESIKGHMQSVHKEETENMLPPKKLFPCEKCDQQLTSKGNYNRHMRLYHDNQEKELFLCKKCDKKLISKESLYIHNKRIHEESGRFICDVCSKPCGSKADLERHSRVHTGEKPYTCCICPKTFKRIHTLKVHMRSAHNQKNKEDLQ